MVGEDGERVNGVLTRFGRLGDGRRRLPFLGNLNRVRAKRSVATVVLADRRLGAFGHPQTHPVAGLRAIRRRIATLADVDTVSLTRLGDGCRVGRCAVLGNADAVLPESGGGHQRGERG